jgi:hypothetical protein
MSKQPRTKTRVGGLAGELGIKDSVNNEILLFKYIVQAKGEDATAANNAFTRRIDDTDRDNPFFRLPGEFLDRGRGA